MTIQTQLFVATMAVAGLLALIGVWAPRRLMVRAGALATAALFLPLSYASMVDLLSRPKPIDLEWWMRESKEATVIGSQIRENQGIDLWLLLPGSSEPRAYVLPWNRNTAERLQQARREAERQGADLRMRLPFETSLEDREPKFYALPQPARPPKDKIDPALQIYDPPGRAA